jgi:hypothetical protein
MSFSSRKRTQKPFDDQGSGHAVPDLLVREMVRMRVVPEQPWRVVRRDVELVVLRVAWHDGQEDVVGPSAGSDAQAMHVQVGRLVEPVDEP